MKLLSIGFVFAELVAFASGQSAVQSPVFTHVAQEVSLCSVLRRPRVYRGHVVQMHADILLAMPHGAVLLDGTCPKRGIQVGIDLPNAEASVTDLIPSILNDCSATPRPETVAGTFIGKLSYSADGRLDLRLVSVRDLEVKPCPKWDAPPPPITWGHMPSALPPK
jgi:hypothetical protein